MKIQIFITIILVVIAGCSQEKNDDKTVTVPRIQELLLSQQDLSELGMTTNGTDCIIEEFQTSEFSPLGVYGTCFYTITKDNTEVVIEYKKFSNKDDLNGAYQYESSHYRSVEGILEQDTYGDQSKFYVNNENDYGAEFNPPGVYFYTLYFTKDEFMVHVTTKGKKEETKEDIANIGRVILSKFG